MARANAAKLDTAYLRWAMNEGCSACPESIDVLVPLADDVNHARDPWGTPYRFVCGDRAAVEALGFGTVSAGRDGRFGTSDDVKGWDESP